MSAIEVFNEFEEIYGIIINENKINVIKLYGDDLIFWCHAYNFLNANIDYDFIIVGKMENKLVSRNVNENTFLNLMELLEKKNFWKDSIFNIEKQEITNHRIHKLMNNVNLS